MSAQHQARPRRYPQDMMPAGSNSRGQQSQPTSTYGSMAANNLVPNGEIWSSFRNQSTASRGSGEDATGSSAFNAPSDADVWSSNPWNPERPPRSPSASPNRTRDGGLPNGPSFFDSTQTSIARRTGLGNQYETNGYNVFGAQRRSPETAFMDSAAGQAARDSISSSRQSGSPASFGDLYSHAPSNSIPSQRHIPSQVSAYQNQNQRAFSLNQHVEDLELQMSRASLDRGNNGTTSFNPATQPFQMNTTSRSFINDSSVPRFSQFDSAVDGMASNHQPFHLASIDRISPASNYRLNHGSTISPPSYTPNNEMWPRTVNARDTRSAEPDRRLATQLQHQGQQYPQSFLQNQYYPTLPAQFPAGMFDPYMRPNMLPGFTVPLHPGFPHGLIPTRPLRDQDSGKGIRSAVLEEFRINASKSTKRFELKDIYNHVVEFSGDQHGSRFIQQKLEAANSDEKDRVFKEIEPNAIQLMKDVFGNYVIQKFYEHGDQIQKKILTEKMKGKVFDLSTQVYACRVVQKALDFMLVEQQAQVARELGPRITELMKDTNGNHVAQKIIEVVPREHWDYVMTTFRGRIPDYSTHSFACRVVQRALEKGTDEDKAQIMAELNGSMQMLVTDQFGNYVMQHVLKKGKPEDRDRVISLVLPQTITLSKHKFASNVVERCIQHGNNEQRTQFRNLVAARGSDGYLHLPMMLRDQYANYVVQRLLEELKGAEQESFVEEVKPLYLAMRKQSNSRQILSLERLLGLADGAAPSKNGVSSYQVDVNSAAPTPVLTNETNSPQSSSPPSTNASAVGALGVDAEKMPIINGVGSPRVQANEA